MIILFAVAAITSFVLVVMLTPAAIRLAHHINALDVPDERKVHKRPIPRLGGIAIFPAVVLTVLGVIASGRFAADELCSLCKLGPFLLIGATLMLAIGIVDDVKPVRALTKLLVQCIAAIIVVAAGLSVTVISNPFGAGSLSLGWLSAPLTVFWIVGVTNATNLIDGLDGLASGIGAIACTTIGIYAILAGDYSTALLALILAGALLGFLRFNFHPARVFLGDSGSLFLGFALACLSVLGSGKGSTAFAFVVPVLSMGLPLLDTFLAIARRSVRAVRVTPNEISFSLRRLVSTVTKPDKEHLHHRLLALGIPHRQAVLVLYAVSFSLGFGALGIGIANSLTVSFIGATAAIVTFVGVWRLDRLVSMVRDGRILRNLTGSGVESPRFQAALDVCFMLVSGIAVSALAGHQHSAPPAMWIILIAIAQSTVFIAVGVYKVTLRMIGISGTLQLLKASTIAATCIAVFTVIINGEVSQGTVVATLLDFFFLTSLVFASRLAFWAVYRRASTSVTKGDAKRVLIYGTGGSSMRMLDLLLHSGDKSFVPLGFLDEDPLLEGKTVRGYPVFGGHWKIEHLARKLGASEIFLAEDDLPPILAKRIRLACRRANISTRKVAFQINSISAPLPHRTAVSVRVMEPQLSR